MTNNEVLCDETDLGLPAWYKRPSTSVSVVGAVPKSPSLCHWQLCQWRRAVFRRVGAKAFHTLAHNVFWQHHTLYTLVVSSHLLSLIAVSFSACWSPDIRSKVQCHALDCGEGQTDDVAPHTRMTLHSRKHNNDLGGRSTLHISRCAHSFVWAAVIPTLTSRLWAFR